MKKIPDSIRKMPKVELHQHVDGSIPPAVTWRIMKRYELNPVETLAEMKKLLQLQPEEEGSLLAYLDKFHFPMWITQFYENIEQVSEIPKDELRGAKSVQTRLEDNKQVALDLCELLDKQPADAYLTYVADRPFNDCRYDINTDKLCELGWQPRVSFEELVAQMVEADIAAAETGRAFSASRPV